MVLYDAGIGRRTCKPRSCALGLAPAEQKPPPSWKTQWKLSFLLRALSATLPTPLNLAHWRYREDSSCLLSGSQSPQPPRTEYISSGTEPSLLHLKTWQHPLEAAVAPEGKLYWDLEGFRAMDNPPSTVPHELLATLSRPDIVFIGDDKTIIIVELWYHSTVPTPGRPASTSCFWATWKVKGSGHTSSLMALGHWLSKIILTPQTLDLGISGRHREDC